MLKSSCWTVRNGSQNTQHLREFSSLEAVFKLSGERVTSDPISSVHVVTIEGVNYYVKRYTKGGKRLKKFIGRSRIRAEWENMLFFQQIGVPAATVIAYGEEKKLGAVTRGALITEEAKDTKDLKFLVDNKSPLISNKRWMSLVISQVAAATKKLHENGFIHTDLKWRNILVTQDDNPQIYFIDCPAGVKQSGWLLRRNRIKDLACLDKVAKYTLRKTQRLSFYKQYAGIESLQEEDKKIIKKVVRFFEGRE